MPRHRVPDSEQRRIGRHRRIRAAPDDDAAVDPAKVAEQVQPRHRPHAHLRLDAQVARGPGALGDRGAVGLLHADLEPVIPLVEDAERARDRAERRLHPAFVVPDILFGHGLQVGGGRRADAACGQLDDRRAAALRHGGIDVDRVRQAVQRVEARQDRGIAALGGKGLAAGVDLAPDALTFDLRRDGQSPQHGRAAGLPTWTAPGRSAEPELVIEPTRHSSRLLDLRV